uniref:Cc-nbs-lrr resistance protein n=1 Tax=Solanum tuberosum TaxID=4113 RepID=M1ART8_SOLTU
MLRDELTGRKYLLVLDDLWHVNPLLWHDILNTLRGINTSRGNFILVTTRMELVASIVTTIGPHMLEKLAKDHCWSIFRQSAFVVGEVPEEMLSMKNKIVEMCQGLPLAATVLGGLLGNKDKHEWQAILDGNPLVAGENSIMKILKLSYDYLPSPHLKKCFGYFAMFPKDFEFEKEQLIQLWMAEGFLCPSQEIPVMEDVGNKFFQHLLKYSLLQDFELDEHNNITHCNMHDLAGDTLKSKLFDTKSVGGENLSQARYFGWDSPSDQVDTMNEFLRVLNLSGSGIKELSVKISKLIYLRYLDLSNTQIEDFPNSICKLYNLQTFRVNDFSSLRKLPREMASGTHGHHPRTVDGLTVRPAGQVTDRSSCPWIDAPKAQLQSRTTVDQHVPSFDPRSVGLTVDEARSANARNANAVPLVPDQEVLNTEFRNANSAFGSCMTNVPVPTNRNGGSVAARV